MQKELLEVNVINLRDYTTYPRAQVDDYPFGGGAGMVLMVEPLVNAIEALKQKTNYDEIIYLTPDGETFNQKIANSLSRLTSKPFFGFGWIETFLFLQALYFNLNF